MKYIGFEFVHQQHEDCTVSWAEFNFDDDSVPMVGESPRYDSNFEDYHCTAQKIRCVLAKVWLMVESLKNWLELIDLDILMLKIKVGDRVHTKPYNCPGRVTKVEWQEELKLVGGLSIPAGHVYWVELENKDLKPRGFSDECLELITV